MPGLVRSAAPWPGFTAGHRSCISSVEGVQPDTLLVTRLFWHIRQCARAPNSRRSRDRLFCGGDADTGGGSPNV